MAECGVVDLSSKRFFSSLEEVAVGFSDILFSGGDIHHSLEI